MLLPQETLEALATEIRLQHLGFATWMLGVDAVGIDEDTYNQLLAGGYVTPEAVQNHVLAAYRAGHLAAWQDTAGGNVPKGTVDAMFAAALKAGMPPLSSPQSFAVRFATQRAAQYVLGLGNRVAADFTTLAIETETAVRAEMKQRIAEQVATSIVYRETARKLASRLGDATDDWSRDLKRIAVTELEFAYQNGWADHIEENVGPDAQVAKRVNADACSTCARLLLGPDGNPRVFSLSELRANGTNFGRKQKEWLPVVGPLHPRCFPAGTMVSTPTGTRPIEAMRPGDAVLAPDGSVQRVEGAWVSAIDAHLIVLDGAGWSLTATENHRVLTSRGLVAAQTLQPGDDLVGEAGDVGQPSRSLPPDPNSHEGPTSRCQERRFAVVLSGFARSGVPVSAVYLDGEMHIGEGEIDQKGADQIAWYRIETTCLQRLEHGPLGLRLDLPGLAGGHPLDLLRGQLATSCRLMGRSDERVAAVLRQVGPSVALAVRSGTLNDPVIVQGVHDRGPLDVQLRGDLQHRESFLNVHANDGWSDNGTSAFGTDAAGLAARSDVATIGTHAREDAAGVNAEHGGYFFYRAFFIEVQAASQLAVENGGVSFGHAPTMPRYQRVVNVRRVPFRGLVYNLHVSGPHQYVANGIGVSNCHCVLIHVPAGFGFNAQGQMLPLSVIQREAA